MCAKCGHLKVNLIEDNRAESGHTKPNEKTWPSRLLRPSGSTTFNMNKKMTSYELRVCLSDLKRQSLRLKANRSAEIPWKVRYDVQLFCASDSHKRYTPMSNSRKILTACCKVLSVTWPVLLPGLDYASIIELQKRNSTSDPEGGLPGLLCRKVFGPLFLPCLDALNMHLFFCSHI